MADGDADTAPSLRARHQTGLLDYTPLAGTPFWRADAEMAAGRGNVAAILLPQATAASVRELDRFLHAKSCRQGVIALVETARGLEELPEILASSDRLIALQFGGEDYTASIGVKCTAGGEEISYARARLVNAAHAWGLEAFDTPFTVIGEPELLRADAVRARNMGFTGKAVIHPAHIVTVKDVFRPDDAEIDHAQRLLAAYRGQSGDGKGVFSFEGAMVDAPVLKRAMNVLHKADLGADAAQAGNGV